MDYFLKEIIVNLQNQREILLVELSNLNENLPNYVMKCSELNNQILNIDNQVRDYILSYKDVKMLEMSNELSIKTQVSK